MSTKEELTSAIAQAIDANWDAIVAEIDASLKKVNQIDITAFVKKAQDESLSFNFKLSFRKQTVVSQPTTILIDSSKK